MRRHFGQISNYTFDVVTDPVIRTHRQMADTVDWYNQDVLPWVIDQFGPEGERWRQSAGWGVSFSSARDAFAFKMRWG